MRSRTPRPSTVEFAVTVSSEVARSTYREIIQEGTMGFTELALFPDQIQDFAHGRAALAEIALRENLLMDVKHSE